MELKLQRVEKDNKATIGGLFIDGEFLCSTLEDVDRGLKQTDTLVHIQEVKVQNQTAIPSGRYEVIIDMSTRFKINLPHILNVPGFEGIRIHPGNSDIDTDGCILLGVWNKIDKDWISNSRDIFNIFFPKLQEGLKQGNVWINIV